MKTQSGFRRWARRIALVGFGLVTVAGIYAYRLVFARPGEASLALIPEDSALAASLDLSPSPEQAILFKRIDDAIGRNGVKEPFQRSLFDLVEHSPYAAPIRELTTRSAAACLLTQGENKQDMGPVLLMPLTDGGQADHILHEHGSQQFWKGTAYFRFPHSETGMMVIGDTLVVSPAPWALHEVGQVAKGERKSITTSSAFQAARSAEPSNANLFLYVSPDLVKQGFALAKMDGTASATASITIQDDGLAFAAHGKFDDPSAASFKRMLTEPLRPDLLQILPPGAYSVFAVSQPGKQADQSLSHLTDSKAGGPDVSNQIKKVQQKVKDETGIDLNDDVFPAFKGDTIFAAYPSEEPAAGIDLLFVVDNRNGANPAELADKLQAYVDRESRKSQDVGPDWFTHFDHDGATAYRLSDKVQDELHKNMKGSPQDPIHYDKLLGNKTVAWAKVDGSVLISTSQDLLDRAVDTLQGKGSAMSSDAVLKAPADSSDGSSSLGVISFSRLAEGVRNTMDASKMDESGRKIFNQVIGMFQDLKRPLSVRGRLSPDGTLSASFFVPMDYDKMIDFVGSMANKKG